MIINIIFGWLRGNPVKIFALNPGIGLVQNHLLNTSPEMISKSCSLAVFVLPGLKDPEGLCMTLETECQIFF